MKTTFENINKILAEWDPISVGETIAADEYRGYIPTILQSVNDKEQLMNCLESILVDQIGIDYNPANKEHFNDLQQICEKIIQVYNNTNALSCP